MREYRVREYSPTYLPATWVPAHIQFNTPTYYQHMAASAVVGWTLSGLSEVLDYIKL